MHHKAYLHHLKGKLHWHTDILQPMEATSSLPGGRVKDLHIGQAQLSQSKWEGGEEVKVDILRQVKGGQVWSGWQGWDPADMPDPNINSPEAQNSQKYTAFLCAFM